MLTIETTTMIITIKNKKTTIIITKLIAKMTLVDNSNNNAINGCNVNGSNTNHNNNKSKSNKINYKYI